MVNDMKKSRQIMSDLALYFSEDSLKQGKMDDNLRQILRSVEQMMKALCTLKIEESENFFRARIINPLDVSSDKGFIYDNEIGGVCSGYNEFLSGTAPILKTRAQRLNRQWESVLYVADDTYTAISEVRPGIRTQISVAKYNKKHDSIIKVLDFSKETPKFKKSHKDIDLKNEFYLDKELLLYYLEYF